ncbi:MAG: AMP-dependent synthetase [Rhodospirillaceae bacterium]|nr:AMP-dependent synthetase [Rhodospirillaceae bacterium]
MTIDVENFRNRRNNARWNRVSVGDVIERMTWNEPGKVAFIATPEATVDPAYARVTYSEANDVINRVANALLALNLPRASRIAMLCDNSNEAWLAKVGVAKAGLVAAPINVMMASDVIAEALQRVGAQHAIVDQALWEPLEGTLAPANIRPIVSIGGPPQGRIPNFEEFMSEHGADEPDVEIHGDDIWQVLFTSGTTAKPKAVMISHTSTYMAAYSKALTMTRGLSHESEIRLGVFTPMVFHIGDQHCVFGPLVCGGTVIIGRKPQGPEMARAITDEKVTCLFGGSPQFVESLITEVQSKPEEYDLSSLGVMWFGWAPLAPASLAAFQELCGPQLKVYEMIAQTEAIAGHRFFIDRHLDMYLREAPAINHVGKPSPIMGATVMDETGQDLRDKPGVAGEAVYRTPAMFSGYYRDLEATQEAVRGDWFHSGDSFVYGQDQIRLMVDRYKDIVKSGGENVSSIRVESVLQQHPTVIRAAVIGLPDDRWGEMVTACILKAPNTQFEEKALIGFARERLAGFETPKRIVVMDEFPTTVGGKVLKYKLRQYLLAGS